ncbi:MAG: response regulator [Magnetococcales bacterium]|nr:response regulator [Magnetococcales bacterium]
MGSPERIYMVNGKSTILIIEDEKSNIDVLVGLLREHYKIIVARDGEQGLIRAQAEPPPDLILLDIIMPGMDGFEVCQRLKEQPHTREVPVVFITGMNEIRDETRGFEVGAVDFIRKPFSPSVVLARVVTQLSLQQQRSRLQKLNDVKNRFLGMTAHDLRGPIGSIHGLSEMLLNMPMSDSQREKFLSTIFKASGQLLTLVDDLLDVSVIESGSFDLNDKPGDLSMLVRERLELAQLAIEKKEVTVASHLEETPNAHFDHERMAQVLDNLISNALKFTPTGSTISLRSGMRDQQPFFQISDQGPGIKQEERGKLFLDFQKLSAQPTDNEKSTGLGLAIVKRIVDAHGGRIEVEDGSHGGALFTLYLPSIASRNDVAEKPTILVVDDEFSLRLMLSKAFQQAGFTMVGEAEDGLQGLRLFKERRPDITLLDLDMPPPNGQECLQQILQIDPHACVVILSSTQDAGVEADCLHQGAAMFLSKERPYSEIHESVLGLWSAFIKARA